MAYVLDLRKSHKYTLELTLDDADQTTLRVGVPTEAQVEEIMAAVPDLRKLEKGDKESIDLIYDLAARLISRNREFVEVTPDDLREKYRMDVETLIVFLSAYVDFIEKIKNEKN